MKKFLLMLAFVLGLSSTAQAQISVIDSSQGNSAGAASASTTLPVDAGNGIIVAVSWDYQTRTISSVADAGVNTYTAAGSLLMSNFVGVHLYYVCSAATSATLTITATLSSTVDNLSVQALELTGQATTSCYDKESTGSGASGANNQSVASFTPTDNNSIVIATHVMTSGNQAITGQAGTIAQTQYLAPNNSGTFTTQYLVQTTATATTMFLTSSNGGGTTWGEKAIVIKAAGGGAVTPKRLLLLGAGGIL